MSSKLVPITMSEYRALFDEAQSEHLSSGEPIPSYNDNSASEIKYLLNNPFNVAFGKVLYWGFYKKASILFYTMIKNHPLANGNKRMACYCLAFFYEKNNRRFNIPEGKLYEMAHYVTNSHRDDFNEVLVHIKDNLKKYD